MTKRRKTDRYREPKSPELQARNEGIVRARMFGGTIRGIAKSCGLSPSRVHAIVAGVLVLFPRPKRQRKSRARPGRWLKFFRLRSEARALRKLGYSYHEIAERLGISHGCVYNAARMVKIAELQGRAWLSHEEGRPRAWKRDLLARTVPPATPFAKGPASPAPGYAVPS